MVVKHGGFTVAVVNETEDKLSNMCLQVFYTFVGSLYFVQFARGLLTVTFLSSPILLAGLQTFVDYNILYHLNLT